MLHIVIITLKKNTKKLSDMTPREKAEQLLEKVRPHTQYWDCYNDCPLEENHAKKVVLLWLDEIQEHAQMIQTQYEGYSTPYQYFVRVKEELSKL